MPPEASGRGSRSEASYLEAGAQVWRAGRRASGPLGLAQAGFEQGLRAGRRVKHEIFNDGGGLDAAFRGRIRNHVLFATTSRSEQMAWQLAGLTSQFLGVAAFRFQPLRLKVEKPGQGHGRFSAHARPKNIGRVSVDVIPPPEVFPDEAVEVRTKIWRSGCRGAKPRRRCCGPGLRPPGYL